MTGTLPTWMKATLAVFAALAAFLLWRGFRFMPNTTLLIIHGLLAFALLGAITHQTVAVVWPSRPGEGFVTSFRAVAAARYTQANVWLYLTSTLLGAVIYPAYRLAVRPYLESARLGPINGAFELKEQFAALGLGLLPLYWVLWRRPLEDRHATARAVVTSILCFVVWYGFLAGHIINNVRGLYGR